MDNIGFVYCTCDKYDDVWNIFFKYLTRFWPEMNYPIYLCTEQKEYSYGELDIRCPLSSIHKDFSSWSYRLITLLEMMPYEYVIFMLDDFVLTQPVQHSVVKNVISYIKSDPMIGYICLHQELTTNSNDERKKNAERCDNPHLHRCLKGMPYRITTQAGIWRKSYLLKLLKKHENAWQFEVRGNKRANMFYNNYKIFDVNEPIVEYPSGGIIWRGKFQNAYKELFPYEDISDIICKRGTITKSEMKNIGKHKSLTYRDYWNFILSFLPF